MNRLITIEASAGLAERLERLLRRTDSEIIAEQGCVLLVHEPPERDALAWLGRVCGPGLPARPTIVLTPSRDRQLRRSALAAGAMEVLAVDELEHGALVEAIADAQARFACLQRSARAEREQLEFHLENSPLAVVEWAADFRCSRWTGQAEGMFGWTADEVLGLHPSQWPFVHPDDQLAVDEIMRALSEGDVLRNVSRNRNVRRDGSVGEYEWYNSVRRDADGRLRSVFSLVFDATEQRRAEAEARAAVERAQAEGDLLDAVLDAAPAGIIVADASGRLLRFNKANELLWGPAPLSGSVDEYREWRGWWADQSVRHGRRIAPHEWAMARALRGETVRDDVVEIEPFDRPGARRTMVNSGAPVRDAEGRITGAVVAQMDITALVTAEAARRESEERFRGLADNIAQLAWMADEDGWIFWYNRRWFEFTGTTLAQVQGWGWTKLHHPDHVERVTSKFRRHLVNGEPWEDTFPIRGGSGEYRWFLSRAIPIRDAAGKVVRWFGTNTDVTEQREAEQALREADRRKDEFIAVLAHELRNPLAPVRNSVEILRRIGADDPLLQRVRDVIDRQVTHMARLIDDLLDVSRIARGKLALDKRPCDLAAIARQTAEDYRTSLEAEGLRLAIVGSPGPIWVDGEPTRLAQMVGNLLHNAGRFTPPGGAVEVEVAADELSRHAVVEVRDTGVGIEAELLARLFDPFSQADQDLARSKGGLGLGLALTKGLAELHGGGVAADSAGPGEGAVFTIRIPLQQQRPSDAAAPPDRAAPVGGLRVLVVEDNVDAAQTLGDLLELLGFEVRLAYDGAQALALVDEFAPEAVVSDLGLPGEVDGYELARRVHADPEPRRPLLIALSGYANEQARRRSREAGFDVHLAKPPDLAELERLLRERQP